MIIRYLRFRKTNTVLINIISKHMKKLKVRDSDLKFCHNNILKKGALEDRIIPPKECDRL